MTEIKKTLPGSDVSAWVELVPSFFKRGILGTFIHYTQKYGPCYKLKLPFNNELFVLSHPDAVQRILRDNSKNYPKGNVYDGARLLLGNGMVTSDGETWKKNRQLCQPSFNNEHISRYLLAMSACTDKLIGKWSKNIGQTIELQQEMNDLTLEIVGATLFGQDLSDQSRMAGITFSTALKGIGTRGPGNLSMPLWIPTPGNISFYLARKRLKRLVKQIIDNFRASKSKQNEDSLLGSLMNAKDENGHGMSDAQLQDEVVTIYLAGFETTSMTLTWAFYVLHNEKEVVKRLRADLAQLPEDNIPLEAMKKLSYTPLFLNELLRLYSPVWTIARNILRPDTVCGYDIRPSQTNAFVLIAPYITHRLTEFWGDNPEEFRPERFISEENKTRHSFSYYPFSSGARVCIGKHFSLFETTLILAKLLRKFTLEIDNPELIKFKAVGTLRPDRKIKATIVEVN